jgi:hypothetical protein
VRLAALALDPWRDRRHSFRAYHRFLERLAAPERYAVVPLRDFAATRTEQTLVGLRHDIDTDLDAALALARLEHAHGFAATYFVLHSAEYYGTRSGRDARVIDVLLTMQEELGHEIGLHNDLVTLEAVHGVDALRYAHDELDDLRRRGLRISGVAAHGSDWCERLGYDNRYFFSDVDAPWLSERFPNRSAVRGPARTIELPRATLADLGFTYEAYHLGATRHFSDIGSPGRRWHTDSFPDDLASDERVVVLTHPEHWARAPWVKYQRFAARFWRRARRAGR